MFNSSAASGTAPSPSRYTFIDGNCLATTLREVAEPYLAKFNTDPSKPPLSPHIDYAKIGRGSQKIFYFDAIPVQLLGESADDYDKRAKPKRDHLEAIEQYDRFHVRTGHAVKRKGKGGTQQKMVDVQLAVEALRLASRGLFQSCTLIMGDLDFKPLIDALVDMGVDVHLFYPPKKTNKELIAAADSSKPITMELARQWWGDGVELMYDMPQFWYNAGKPNEPSDALRVWNDWRFGKCFVEAVNSRYRLVTERAPAARGQHLIMDCGDLNWIRLYASETFGINVPQ